MSLKHFTAFFVLLLASVALVSAVAGVYNINSYPMTMANPQRNGFCANATALTKALNHVAWAFVEPDSDIFRDGPTYSAEDNAVYTAAFTGFVYGINATDGTQLWETCIGTPPVFPGDPCSDSGIGDPFSFPFGQTMLLTDGNVIILREQEGKKPEAIICLNKTTGAIEWTFAAGAEDSFLSTPSVIPQEGGDAILMWMSSYTKLFYSVINGTTGEETNVNSYHARDDVDIAATFSVDPTDETVISQWTDITAKHCNGPYACVGLAKFDPLTGEKIWNVTMEDTLTNGMVAIDPIRNTIYATNTQTSLFAYDLDTGAPLFEAPVVTSTFDQGFASVCADGTVIIVDMTGALVAYNPTPERVMSPIWSLATASPQSVGVTTLADNTFVYSDGNSVIARTCTAPTRLLWSQDFGATDNGPGAVVAVSNDAVYANVYWSGRYTGIIVKITDLPYNCTTCPEDNVFW